MTQIKHFEKKEAPVWQEGQIKFCNTQKGFCFIKVPGSKDVFADSAVLQKGGVIKLSADGKYLVPQEGEKVQFTAEDRVSGSAATEVEFVPKRRAITQLPRYI